MSNRYKCLLFILLALAAVFFVISLARGGNIALLDPRGLIAFQERNLIVTATLLMLVVVIPVYVALFAFARKYRADNAKAKYDPDLDNNAIAGFAWWAIPATIIFILAIMNWKSTHALDPYKPLVSDAKPITIQVIALQWKWLFIYPEQNIATVNYIQFPEHTPINFKVTADAPMNSFWIPQLGGQIYAMPGMSTQLHLMANGKGSYNGSSTEISGRGFSGMKFIAESTSQIDFDQWVQSVKQSPNILTLDSYNKLSEPSENNPVAYYASTQQDMYNTIIMKFMKPMPQMEGMTSNVLHSH